MARAYATHAPRGLLHDALDHTAVDVQVTGYGSLAVTRVVPLADRALQGPSWNRWPRWLPPWAERTSVRGISMRKSRRWTTLPGSSGTVKLGQPVWLSNLLTEANSGSPDTTST